ncbi:MAG: hypothetical protein IJM17_04525 [Firmicutes bacterium]|nr:hypothetical protein [Bacillota bacterium]
MKKRSKTRIILLAALVCALVFACAYTRPMTAEERWPVLDLSRCTRIRCSYWDHINDSAEYYIEKGEPGFDEIVLLIGNTPFRAKLSTLFERGTRYRRLEEGDVSWSLNFRFEDVHMPNGDTVSGEVLGAGGLADDIWLMFDGDVIRCGTADQKQWCEKVVSLIVPGSE